MERQVTFRDRQEQQAADHNNLQAFARESIDDLVFDAVTPGRAYAGLEVTAASATTISVAVGRYFNGGARYVSEAAQVINLFQYLPLVTRRKLAIVAWGTVVDIDEQSRDFLVNSQTRTVEPSYVSMESRRQVNLAAIAGNESPDPQAPSIDIATLAFCYVVLTPSGIESITMIDAARVPQLGDHETRIESMETWRDTTEPRIGTLASDITALAQGQASVVTKRAFFEVTADVARLKEVAGLPDTYASYGADRFLDKTATDTTDVTLYARVEEGVRFPDANANEQALTLFNPLNGLQMTQSGVMLPAFDFVRRLDVLADAGVVNASSYGYQSITMQQLTMSRARIRTGQSFVVCTNSAFWQSGTYDPISGIFSKDGETFHVLAGTPLINHTAVRLEQYWTDFYDEPYWDALVTNLTITGAHIAQTFLNSQDGWCKGIDLYFFALAASGDMTVSLCETRDDGAPDLTRVIARTTLLRANMRLNPLSSFVEIAPTFLKAGKRYSWSLVTNAAHQMVTANASGSGATATSYTQGTLFYSTDGVYQQGDLTKDLKMSVYFAKFRQTRTVIELNPLSLSGGMTDIDMLASLVIPGSTSMSFEVQIGGVWYALNRLNKDVFIGLPPLVPLHVVFVNTTDCAAGIMLGDSRVHYSRSATTFKHPSTSLTLPAPSDQIEVRMLLQNFDPAHHTFALHLKHGVTVENPSVTQTTTPDPSNALTVLKTYTFNLGSAISAFSLIADGTTDTALRVFLINERVHIAFS